MCGLPCKVNVAIAQVQVNVCAQVGGKKPRIKLIKEKLPVEEDIPVARHIVIVNGELR